MISATTRIARFALWIVVTALVILAIAVTVLRITLPQLNHFQEPIKSWISAGTGFDLDIAEINGFWRNTHPSMSLRNIKVNIPKSSGITFSADKIDVELDLFQSILQFQPVVADLNIHQLTLDITSVKAVRNERDNPVLAPKGTQQDVIEQLDSLLLRHLDGFSLLDSTILFQGLDGSERQLDIAKLRWHNNGNQHLADGEISLADSNINLARVKADFVDHGSLDDVSGEFYVSAQNVLISPWLTQYLQSETGIEKGQASFNAWLTLQHSIPESAYLELEASELSWQEGKQHELAIESGVFELEPIENGWRVSGHSLDLRTDDIRWPELDIAFDWQSSQWRLNMSQLDVAAITPLIKLVPDSAQLTEPLEKLAIGGLIEDVRVSMAEDVESLKYSAQLSDGSMSQWNIFPEMHHLSASLSGDWQQAHAKLHVIDDTLPYGDVFQAPLKVKHADLDVVLQKNDAGWQVWADKLTLATPDLQFLGAFRLDVPKEGSPFLSLYGETDLYNAGETWRYLPPSALGQELTDYLSAAIQAGKVKTSKIVWYGKLDKFPYENNDGIFQAWVGMKDAKFSFDTAWPPITELQLDLLFQNDALYFDSHSAMLQDVTAKRITGRIPEIAEDGHLEIEASAVAQGNSVRDYMNTTPLVDSVGAALTAVQVKGQVTSTFQLNIPFDSDKDVRAWGYADLTDNRVEINTPPMDLTHVSGRIEFDKDVVQAAGLAAQLLEQDIAVDFSSENIDQGYGVDIDVVGDWEIEPIGAYLGKKWTAPVEGHAPWRMGVDIQLNDVGFNYQIDTTADLRMVTSDYPYPLNKEIQQPGKARFQASGNQESISARIQLPNLKYQAKIDVEPEIPVLKATNLILGKGSFKVSPIAGHHLQIRTDHLDLDRWLELINTSEEDSKPAINSMNTPTIPMPQRVELNSKEMTLAGVEWNDVDFSAKKKGSAWYMNIESQEASGEANYIAPYDLSVALDRLHLYIPDLDEEESNSTLTESPTSSDSLISEFDRTLHKQLPNLTLSIDDFWLQGYKVGKTNMDIQRQGDVIQCKTLSLESGTNKVEMSGNWLLTDTNNHTSVEMDISGKNNSDVMERFGISSGIQRAPFKLHSSVEWDGAPWSMQISSLQGDVTTKFGKGFISDVSGAAKLLGLFSLDSIIRKMQLDFTDVFDKGMAFNSITGSGQIKNGIFLTNDIKMDAVAGEMSIRGLANLNDRTVDAEVNFVPDITSGIPVLTAFAVTPQTALYVLAITTVISPVVEVFTQVNYQVKGPLDSPEVKELSRSKGEYELPESLRKAVK